MQRPTFVGTFLSLSIAAVLLAAPQTVDETVAQSAPDGAPAGPGPGGPRGGGSDLPKFDDVSKGFEKVQSGDQSSLFGLWVNRKDEQMLAEFPKGWEKMKFFIAATPAGGVIFSGLQGPARYVFWRQYGNRLALVEPQLDVRSNGEPTSKESVKRIFTDKVLLEIPVVATGPSGQPVIDLDQLLVAQGGAISGQALNPRLAKIAKAKAFPQNLEIAVEAPDQGGSYKTVHYSISAIPEQGSYKPRPADDRVGYFLTDYRDLGQYGTETNMVRYINRWDLQKRDPKLSVSPPKEPIVFYVEHTVPVRYRRFVRDGILQWNDAFRKIGIDNAIEVYQQDEVTGAHMEKDPEDVRYNFVRWLNNDVATAIGPSRAHPLTGQILDADIILTDGWIRAFYNWYDERPLDAAASLAPEAFVWLENHPEWDPRLLGLPAAERDAEIRRRAARAAAGDPDPADSRKDPLVAGRPEYLELLKITTGTDGGHGEPGHRCGATCFAAQGLAMDMAFASMQLEIFGMIGQDGTKPTPPSGGTTEPKEDLLDGVPESFVGPQLAHLVAHEVGHTLGLRHNFKSSSLYTLDEINSEEIKGRKPLGGSVMDYLPTNFNVDDERPQGDYTMIGIGPYDFWAIEYGYTFDDPAKVLARVGEPGHMYLTDEDTGGSDPLARRYDFSKDPLDYANAQMALVEKLRARLLAGYVKDGEAWERVRRGYLKTLGKQRQMVDMMAGWIGGTHVNRVKKGDPNTGDPLVPVDPAQQRAALQFVLANAFRDDAFGLNPELLNKMTVEKWGFDGGVGSSSTWPINDQIAAVQGTALTLIVNPATLTRVMDNELRTPAGADAVTLPELMNALSGEIYRELTEANAAKGWSDRNPMVSTFRRNLQTDYTDRLIKVATGNAQMPRTVRQQAQFELEKIGTRLAAMKSTGKLDGYTAAHVNDMAERIRKARESIYVAQ